MKPFYEKPINAPASAGFTIIEVLIALAVFSLGIMAMGALQTASLRSTGNIARMSEALALLDERAESLKVLPFYEAVIPTRVFPVDLVAGAHGPDRRGSGNQFDVHWQVDDDTPIPQQNNANLAYINGLPAGNHTVSKTVTVWVTRAGDTAQVDALARAQFVKTWAAQIPAMP